MEQAGNRISQGDFVWLVKASRLTDKQALYLRLNVGIDDVPLKQSEIARRFGISHQAVNCVVRTAKRKVRSRPFIPGRLDGPRHRETSYNPFIRHRGMITVAMAEKIIGMPVAVGEPEGGYVRVACYDAFDQVFCETARNIPAALELLVRSNFARTREFVLDRDNYRCVNCGALGATRCDLIRSRSRGRSHRPENMLALCDCCSGIRRKYGRSLFTVQRGKKPIESRCASQAGAEVGQTLAKLGTQSKPLA